jgi:hypothetical protein
LAEIYVTLGINPSMSPDCKNSHPWLNELVKNHRQKHPINLLVEYILLCIDHQHIQVTASYLYNMKKNLCTKYGPQHKTPGVPIPEGGRPKTRDIRYLYGLVGAKQNETELTDVWMTLPEVANVILYGMRNPFNKQLEEDQWIAWLPNFPPIESLGKNKRVEFWKKPGKKKGTMDDEKPEGGKGGDEKPEEGEEDDEEQDTIVLEDAESVSHEIDTHAKVSKGKGNKNKQTKTRKTVQKQQERKEDKEEDDEEDEEDEEEEEDEDDDDSSSYESSDGSDGGNDDDHPAGADLGKGGTPKNISSDDEDDQNNIAKKKRRKGQPKDTQSEEEDEKDEQNSVQFTPKTLELFYDEEDEKEKKEEDAKERAKEREHLGEKEQFIASAYDQLREACNEAIAMIRLGRQKIQKDVDGFNYPQILESIRNMGLTIALTAGIQRQLLQDGEAIDFHGVPDVKDILEALQQIVISPKTKNQGRARVYYSEDGPTSEQDFTHFEQIVEVIQKSAKPLAYGIKLAEEEMQEPLWKLRKTDPKKEKYELRDDGNFCMIWDSDEIREAKEQEELNKEIEKKKKSSSKTRPEKRKATTTDEQEDARKKKAAQETKKASKKRTHEELQQKRSTPSRDRKTPNRYT